MDPERDPVCGMRVDSRTAVAKEVYEGKTYYFCSRSCHEHFLANPQMYLAWLRGPA
jgi:Cu+-exporting ATPase